MNQTDYLERMGFGVTRLPVAADGTLTLADVEKAIRDDTAIVSIMWANNETGVLFPVEEIAAICKRKGVLFHTDAVQTPGKIDLRHVAKSDIDFLSMSGHKLHAPKGVGVLYVKRRTKIVPYVIGGGQERGKRGGTENVASIVGLGRAAELAMEQLSDEQTRVRAMRDRFEETLLQRLPHLYINGKRDQRLAEHQQHRLRFRRGRGDPRCASTGKASAPRPARPARPARSIRRMSSAPWASRRRARAVASVSPSVTIIAIPTSIYALEIIPPMIEELRAMSPLGPEHTDNFNYDVEAAREKEEKLMAQTMASINE